tara:strand:- start:302 stop:793 length:492 start_codon:yes stop_codon:yes gene_type:complete
MKYYYGVKSAEHLIETVNRVVSNFGGGERAVQIMLGTCATETHCGRFIDSHPERWGVGVGQCDQICLDDVQMHIRPKDRFRLKCFGYDIGSVVLKDLAYDPTLALSIMRLAYKRVPAALPLIGDLQGLAHYWKDHYNSHHINAAGTPEKFLKDWDRHMPVESQ